MLGFVYQRCPNCNYFEGPQIVNCNMARFELQRRNVLCANQKGANFRLSLCQLQTCISTIAPGKSPIASWQLAKCKLANCRVTEAPQKCGGLAQRTQLVPERSKGVLASGMWAFWHWHKVFGPLSSFRASTFWCLEFATP